MVVMLDIVEKGKAVEGSLNINRKDTMALLIYEGDGPLLFLALSLLQQERRYVDKRHRGHLVRLALPCA